MSVRLALFVSLATSACASAPSPSVARAPRPAAPPPEAREPCERLPVAAEMEDAALHEVWARGGDDIFAVADSQTIFHFDGSRWTQQFRSTDVHLINELVGTGEGTLLAVGQLGHLYRFDGTTWTRTELPTRDNLFHVWAPTSGAPVVVTNNGLSFHLEGATHRRLDAAPRTTLFGVWGSSPSHVFAVGEHGTIVHFDGSAWTARESETRERLIAIWGSGDADVFAVGGAGTIVRFDGTRWAAQATGVSRYALVDVWGSGPNDVYALGISQPPTIEAEESVDSQVQRSRPVEFVGTVDPDPHGVILRFDGSSWRRAHEVRPTPRALFGIGPRDILVSGDHGLLLRCRDL